MSAIATDEYSDELNEGQPRVRSGCTIGRILNLCMALDFLLVMITALIVSGTLGAVNLTLKYNYEDHEGGEVCILYSTCDSAESGPCTFFYNRSGVCKYVEVAFGFIALVALIYIVIAIVRAVLTTNISFTVFVDFAVIVLCVLVAFSTGVTVSIGLSVTCTAIKKHYGNHPESCDLKVPDLHDDTAPTTAPSGYSYYRPVNISQSCSWLCFAFLMVLLIMTIARMIIFFTRRKQSYNTGDVTDITDVLTREDQDEDDDSKPI